ncbi:LPXTG cell wall anchor domain-containing protein [Streptomyces sp. NPDC058877]|uniref:LPXTG cell wall anchor domain-containing protein n=1 Tax=unclassified Streptomyces TaxID=2593676 RepID=UPI0036B490EF
MKIRRILATAVAAAVTTPAVFLSAAPAFADTKPSPASTQQPASAEDDSDEDPSLKELQAAVALAQKEYDEAVVALDKALTASKALDKPEHPLRAAFDGAAKAAEDAAAVKTAAEQVLAAAEQAVKDLPGDATEQQKADAAAAVTTAEEALAEATRLKGEADEDLAGAGTALKQAEDAAAEDLDLAQKAKEAAAEKLDGAKEELKLYEEIGEGCEEDDSVKVALSGPKTVTAGEPAVFSLRVTNVSDRTLDLVNAYVDALRLPLPGEDVDEETGYEERRIAVEWSSADVLEWTPLTEDLDSIEVGKLTKGTSYDVKLRLTVDADAPAGRGVVFSYGDYQNDDESCGIGSGYADLDFGILAAKGDKPKPTPSTSTPAPTVTTGGNTNTTQQGGTSGTPVNGSLAATGANNTLPLGLAAAGAVALGAGALVLTRRRRAGADA